MREYRAMQDHWVHVAPPAYISSAGLAGYKPQPRPGVGVLEEDPAQIEQFLRGVGGGSFG